MYGAMNRQSKICKFCQFKTKRVIKQNKICSSTGIYKINL